MKNFLDGNNSINNSLFLSCTNYIDKIPDTLKDRPSRFRVVQEMTGISDKILINNIIRDISNRIIPGLFTEEEIKDKTNKLTSVTLDEIKHICLDKVTSTYLPKPVSHKPLLGFKRDNIESDELIFENVPYITYAAGLWKDGKVENIIKEVNSNI